MARSEGTSSPADSTGLSRSEAVTFAFGIGAVGVGVDQFTKWFAVTNLVVGEPVNLLGDWVKLSLTRNAGAAFGLGEDFTYVYTGLGLVVFALILFLVFRHVRRLPWALLAGLGLAGVTGNLVDRLTQWPGVFQGWVIDFLYVKHFATFNVADACLTITAALLIVFVLKGVPHGVDKAPQTGAADAAAPPRAAPEAGEDRLAAAEPGSEGAPEGEGVVAPEPEAERGPEAEREPEDEPGLDAEPRPEAEPEPEAQRGPEAEPEPETEWGSEAGRGPDAERGLGVGPGSEAGSWPVAGPRVETGWGSEAGPGPGPEAEPAAPTADSGPAPNGAVSDFPEWPGSGPEVEREPETGLGPEVGSRSEAGVWPEVGSGSEAEPGPDAEPGPEAEPAAEDEAPVPAKDAVPAPKGVESDFPEWPVWEDPTPGPSPDAEPAASPASLAQDAQGSDEKPDSYAPGIAVASDSWLTGTK
ncbi:MAG: signal peptidase II [Propionibacteriaceae bacterium]|jgi:signal peptidase II|nr:signal peptidase II [Propionibacteriaceae bacterium]